MKLDLTWRKETSVVALMRRDRSATCRGWLQFVLLKSMHGGCNMECVMDVLSSSLTSHGLSSE